MAAADTYNVYTKNAKNADDGYAPIEGLDDTSMVITVITSGEPNRRESAYPVVGGCFVCDYCGKHFHMAMKPFRTRGHIRRHIRRCDLHDAFPGRPPLHGMRRGCL